MAAIVAKMSRGSKLLSHEQRKVLSHDPQRQTLCCAAARKCGLGGDGGHGEGGAGMIEPSFSESI